MAEFEQIKVPQAEVSTYPIIQGQFFIVTDSKIIYVDVSDTERRSYAEVKNVTEKERQTLLTPEEGFYYTIDERQLWYLSDRNEWYSITLSDHYRDRANPHHVKAAQIGLGKVENKSQAEILDGLTKSHVITALGYTPSDNNTSYDIATEDIAGVIKSGSDIRVDDTGKVTVIGGTASRVNWNGIQNIPGSFTPSVHAHTNKDISSIDVSKLIQETNDIIIFDGNF